ncbi:conserved hypothetical protein [metagenome]|uniref:Transcriptional regulator n=1 Tax=metagenome TaxID=256318 RepID=A0A2P2BWD4_9ZZZZ
MHPIATRDAARRMLDDGLNLSEVSRALGVSRASLRAWRDPLRPVSRECPFCDGAPLPRSAYGALLGYYLGDGTVSVHGRHTALRICCDAGYQGIIRDVEALTGAVRPLRTTFRVSAPGVCVVQSNWKHWPCLFPQHGPGRKHERRIALEPWQREIVDQCPADFLRGLFHSDGSRVNNWATRVVAGHVKRYDYPRWQFTNNSGDIQHLCCQALDAVDVPWRQSNWKTISVSTRAAVARLDELIGPKR